MSGLTVDGLITFFYYDDLAKASEFYGGVMGFEKVIDVGFAQVFKAHGGVHVGLVDGSRGHLRASREKPVMLTFFSDDIDSWYDRLLERGVEIEQPPKEAEYLRMRTMLFKDPEGYTLEILQWLTKPYGS